LGTVNLVAANKNGTSDPYISCHVKGKKAKTHFKTHHLGEGNVKVDTKDGGKIKTLK